MPDAPNFNVNGNKSKNSVWFGCQEFTSDNTVHGSSDFGCIATGFPLSTKIGYVTVVVLPMCVVITQCFHLLRALLFPVLGGMLLHWVMDRLSWESSRSAMKPISRRWSLT